MPILFYLGLAPTSTWYTPQAGNNQPALQFLQSLKGRGGVEKKQIFSQIHWHLAQRPSCPISPSSWANSWHLYIQFQFWFL